MMVEMTLPKGIYLDFIGTYEVVKMDEGKSRDDTVKTLYNGGSCVTCHLFFFFRFYNIYITKCLL